MAITLLDEKVGQVHRKVRVIQLIGSNGKAYRRIIWEGEGHFSRQPEVGERIRLYDEENRLQWRAEVSNLDEEGVIEIKACYGDNWWGMIEFDMDTDVLQGTHCQIVSDEQRQPVTWGGARIVSFSGVDGQGRKERSDSVKKAFFSYIEGQQKRN